MDDGTPWLRVIVWAYPPQKSTSRDGRVVGPAGQILSDYIEDRRIPVAMLIDYIREHPDSVVGLDADEVARAMEDVSHEAVAHPECSRWPAPNALEHLYVSKKK